MNNYTEKLKNLNICIVGYFESRAQREPRGRFENSVFQIDNGNVDGNVDVALNLLA